MQWARTSAWILRKRIKSQCLVLSVTVAGVLIASSLLAVSDVYSRALEEGGLRYLMSTKDSASINMRVIAQERTLGPNDYPHLAKLVTEFVNKDVGWMLDSIERYGRLSDISMAQREDETPPRHVLSRPFFMTGFQDRVVIIDGVWPSSTFGANGGEIQIEGVVGMGAAERLQLNVGSKVYLYPYASEPSQRITITVVGLMEPLDGRDDYWMGYPAYFDLVDLSEDRFSLPVYVQEEAYLQGIGGQQPSLISEYGWLAYFNYDLITSSVIDRATSSLTGLEVQLNKNVPRTLVITGLDNTLEKYQRDLNLAKIPLLLFLTMLVGSLLYFLFLAMRLLARSRIQETSLLIGRGAGVFQRWALLFLGDGILVFAGVAAGPFLALAIAAAVVPNIPSTIAGEQLNDPVSLSKNMFVLSGLGSIFILGILIFSGTGVSGRRVLNYFHDRARPPSLPLLHRYYLDLVVLVLIGLIWWQIYAHEGFTSRKLIGSGLNVDPVLLLGPILAFVGIAVLMIRVLPVVLKILSWVSDHIGPIWLSFGFKRMARDPLPSMYLMVMILLAAGLGVFTTSVQSTKVRNEQDRVSYTTGADVVVHSRGIQGIPNNLTALNGVTNFSPVQRSVVPVNGKPGVSSALLLGMESKIIGDIAWFRGDFSDSELGVLARMITPVEREIDTINIPEDTTSLGLWARVDGPGIAPNINLSFMDARGRQKSLNMGSFETQTWTYLEAEIDESFQELQWPIDLYAIRVKYPFSGGPKKGGVNIDELTVSKDAYLESREVLINFEGHNPWVAFPTRGLLTDVVGYSQNAAHTGDSGLEILWTDSLVDSNRGALIPTGPFPIPALAGEPFRAGDEIRILVGREKIPVPIIVVGETKFFPTAGNRGQSFLIVDTGAYSNYMKVVGLEGSEEPQEFWLSLDNNINRQVFAENLRASIPTRAFVVDRAEALAESHIDPLNGSGWWSLNQLGLGALISIVFLAMLLHGSVVITNARMDIAVTKVLGFSRAQMGLTLAIEMLFMVSLGVLAGATTGLFLASWVLDKTDVNETGAPMIPPNVLTIDPWSLGLVLGALGAMAVVSTIVAWVAANRVTVTEQLRLGQ